MNIMLKTVSRLSMLALAAFAVAAPIPSLAQSAPRAAASEAPRKGDIKQDIGDSLDALKNYSAAQKDEAVKKAKAALDEIDARVSAIEGRIETHWNRMSRAGRQEAQATLKSLRRQRIELAQWYGGIEHSSTQAWDEVKRGFAESYRALSESLSKAKKKF